MCKELSKGMVKSEQRKGGYVKDKVVQCTARIPLKRCNYFQTTFNCLNKLLCCH